MTGRKRFCAMLAVALGPAVLAACDLLITDPRPAGPDVSISFQVAETPVGGTSAAFLRVRRIFLRFVRPDSSVRDTVIPVLPVSGRIRAGVALQTQERVQALGIIAQLGFATTPLFAGATVVPIVPGVPTVANITILPIPAAVAPDRDTLVLANVGATAQLSSAVLFASGDTIDGLSGAWSSLDPTVVAVSPMGLALGQRIGTTFLEVRFDTLTATVFAEVR